MCNFIYHNWECTSNYRPLSCPLRYYCLSKKISILKKKYDFYYNLTDFKNFPGVGLKFLGLTGRRSRVSKLSHPSITLPNTVFFKSKYQKIIKLMKHVKWYRIREYIDRVNLAYMGLICWSVCSFSKKKGAWGKLVGWGVLLF